MPRISGRIELIDRDVQLLLNEGLDGKGRSLALARFAEQQIEDTQQANARVLGRLPPYTQTVDGRKGAPLQSVKPDGVIVAEFDLFNEALIWIAAQLEAHSPVKTGRYQKSHVLYIDGVESAPTVQRAFEEAAFVNSQPYARKIERGLSPQAPDGVYQAVATLAQRRFGNIARVKFSYRTILGGGPAGAGRSNKSNERNPAVIVTLRG